MAPLRRNLGLTALAVALVAAASLGAVRALGQAQRGAGEALDRRQAGAITLAEGVALPEVAAALAEAIGGVVVADVSRSEQRLSQPLNNTPLDAALRAIAADFDRFCAVRGRTIALQLRRSDPDEPVVCEMEELRLAAADLARQLTPVNLMEGPGEWTAARARFVGSTTPAQRERMLHGGLPFGELFPAQQRALLELSLTNSYDEVTRQARRADYLIQRLEQAQATALSGRSFRASGAFAERARAPVAMLRLRVNGSPSTEGETFFSFRFPIGQAAELEPGALRGPFRADLRAQSAADGVPWRVPVQQMTLREAAVEWQRAIGSPLRIPRYAAERRFWIAAAGGSRTEAIQALADLWGWETTAGESGRRLGRPVFGAPGQPADMLQGVRRAIPPAIWHAAAHTRLTGNARRHLLRVARLYDEIVRYSGTDRPLAVADLSPEIQHELATLALETWGQEWLGETGGSTAPPSYLTHPEQITLTLTGPLGGDRVPTIWVRGAGAAWGWPARTVPPPVEAIDQ